MTDQVTKQIEAMDMLAAGIDAPTITRAQAEKWGMLDSEHYKWSCLVREIAAKPLSARRQYLGKLSKKYGDDSDLVRDFKIALKFEWERLRDNT